MTDTDLIARRLNDEFLEDVFPAERSHRFFEALLGDADEGAYDIRLAYKGPGPESLSFEFQLVQRPGKCLRCNLTYGLPQVFRRHPVIDVKGLVQAIARRVGDGIAIRNWQLGRTAELAPDLHVIPLTVFVAPARDG